MKRPLNESAACACCGVSHCSSTLELYVLPSDEGLPRTLSLELYVLPTSGGLQPGETTAHSILYGAEGDRTPDLCSAIAALSQLSYSPRNLERATKVPTGRTPAENVRPRERGRRWSES